MNTMLLTEAIQQGIVTVGDTKKGIIGDYIDYRPVEEKCILTPDQTGWREKQSFKTEQLCWRLEQVGSKVLLLPDEPTNSPIILKGKIGYDCGIQAMNYFVSKLFSSPMVDEVTVVTEEMFKAGISRCSKAYWIGLSYLHIAADDIYLGMYYVFYDLVNTFNLYYPSGYSDYSLYGVRPVVSLKPDIRIMISEGNYGFKERPWKILKGDKDVNGWLERFKEFVNKMK